jgi:hypothetical protein
VMAIRSHKTSLACAQMTKGQLKEDFKAIR